jgi:preprotein translocase subunit SecG
MPVTLVAVIHVIAAIILIGLVLVQDSKGAMGGSFGGGGSSNSILGPTGAPNFLEKATRYIAILFAVTSMFLTKMSTDKANSALDEVPAAASTAVPKATAPIAPAPAPEKAPAAPATPQNH